MITRMLPKRHGDPWVMRFRSGTEMDALAGETEFRRKPIYINSSGIFSVVLESRGGAWPMGPASPGTGHHLDQFDVVANA